jgi:site-specific recombinase XerD
MAAKFEIREVQEAWLRQSVLAIGVAPFVLSLTSHAYTNSTIRGYVGAVAHIALWMTQERLALGQLDERLLDRFIDEHVPHCQCPRPATRVISNVRAAVRRFILTSRHSGLLPSPPADHVSPSMIAELGAFDEYLEGTRGLSLATRAPRLRIIADFLAWRFCDGALNLDRLVVTDVHGFVIARLSASSAGKAAVITSALRSYLRFCALRGQSTDTLRAAVPVVAQWPLDRLPQVLGDALIEDVERTFDLSTAGGMRDHAMFRLMLDLGLRVSEVVGLQLQDIDWRAGTLRVASSKCRRVDLLPLAWETANAIIRYLCHARPQTTHRRLFVRKTAPLDIPITLNAVRAAMRQAYARCGHAELSGRTHVLRHTAASRMLRSGTPLKQIADVLRHRSLDTTTIYAKVDAIGLAAVAMPWPGSRP